VALAALRESLPEALGRGVPRQGRAADRLAEEGRDGLSAGRLEHPVELVQRTVTRRVEAPARRRDVHVTREVLTVR
jgi:hypothetical protein